MRELSSQLKLSYGALTTYEFNALRIDQEVKDLLSSADLYVIARKPLPIMELIDWGSDGAVICITTNDFDDKLVIKFTQEKNTKLFGTGLHAVRLGNNTTDKKAFHSITFYGEDDRFIMAANFERFMQLNYNHKIDIDIKATSNDALSKFLTYEVLYVGHCANQHIYDRFKTHHALLEILIQENIVPPNYDKSNELVILPFSISGELLTTITPFSTQEELNNDLPSVESITLDCEKALVKAMNPKYNRTKFKNYPKSIDGLHKFNLKEYSFEIDEPLILLYENNQTIKGGFEGDPTRIIIRDNNEFVIV